MHGFECAKSLVDEVLAMVVGEILGSDHTVHVCFHKFLACCKPSHKCHPPIQTHLNKIDLGEGLVIPWLLNVKNGDDVFVVEVS